MSSEGNFVMGDDNEAIAYGEVRSRSDERGMRSYCEEYANENARIACDLMQRIKDGEWTTEVGVKLGECAGRIMAAAHFLEAMKYHERAATKHSDDTSAMQHAACSKGERGMSELVFEPIISVSPSHYSLHDLQTHGLLLEYSGHSRCTVVGLGVPHPGEDDVFRIGCGARFLEIAADGTASIVGADGDEAVAAVLAGIKVALSMNPYSIHTGKL